MTAKAPVTTIDWENLGFDYMDLPYRYRAYWKDGEWYKQGLEEDALYQLNHGDVYSGSELMYAGISIPNTKEDFHSEVWYFTKL